MKMSAAILVALLLAGCAGRVPDAPTSLAPICNALGAPIEYNTRKIDGPWHAGPSLAATIDERNRVGQNLPCPGY